MKVAVIELVDGEKELRERVLEEEVQIISRNVAPADAPAAPLKPPAKPSPLRLLKTSCLLHPPAHFRARPNLLLCLKPAAQPAAPVPGTTESTALPNVMPVP